MTHPPFRDIDIGLYSVSSTAENRAAARRAEARGFRRVWLAEDHHSRDIFVQATAVGVATETIEIGLGIVNPYTRHPAQIAMAVADLEELAGPRFALGLGAGWSSIAAHGLENPRPITALREAAEICREMLGGGRVAYEGSLYRLPAPGARLTFRPPRPGVPLYFGTMGPRTLRMAAPMADGVFFSVLASPAYVEHCLGHAQAGLAAAGRDADEVDVACYIIFSVDEDGDAARAAAKGLIAHYLMRIKNSPDNVMDHNIDFHASTGALGGGGLTLVEPGQQVVLRWKATKPGTYIYHCAPGGVMIPYHVVSGMSGAVMVLPKGGLKDRAGKALRYDRIYYVGEQDFYVPRDAEGNYRKFETHAEAMEEVFAVMRTLTPSHVVLNGKVGALTGDGAMKARVGETVLIVHSQANRDSRPHLIGGHGDYVWEAGSFADPPEEGLETWFIRGGSAGAALYTFLQPGVYAYLSHNLIEAVQLGALAHFVVDGKWDDDLMTQVSKPGPIPA